MFESLIFHHGFRRQYNALRIPAAQDQLHAQNEEVEEIESSFIRPARISARDASEATNKIDEQRLA